MRLKIEKKIIDLNWLDETCDDANTRYQDLVPDVDRQGIEGEC